jgi:hypothetical protein
MAERDYYTVVLTEPVRAELDGFLAGQAQRLPLAIHAALERDLRGWLSRVHLERWPHPSQAAIDDAVSVVLPALRHGNDLPGAVAARQARPDWVVSANTEHWNDELAHRLGVHVVTPNGFLRLLTPRRGPVASE